MHHPHELNRVQVIDALYEASLTRPEIAGANHVRPSALRAAFHFIPDEYHATTGNLVERFIESVIANAAASGRSPYVIALFALDVA